MSIADRLERRAHNEYRNRRMGIALDESADEIEFYMGGIAREDYEYDYDVFANCKDSEADELTSYTSASEGFDNRLLFL